MAPKLLKEMKHFNEAAERSSWTLYKQVLELLVGTNTQPNIDTLSRLIRDDKVSDAVGLADSLSSQQYSSAREHFGANQVAALIRKYPFPDELNPFDPEGEAVRKFWVSERNCAHVNHSFLSGTNMPDNAMLHKMRSFIQYVIGYEPCLKSIWERCGFGPGANVGVHGDATHLARKLSSEWSVSASAFHYARAACSSDFHLFELVAREAGRSAVCLDIDSFHKGFEKRARLVNYNKIAFVPKTVKTYRSIAVEPLLNSYLQKGVDQVMRGFLRRIGIDLRDQSLNAEFARQGSLDVTEGSYVTIDLSSASDSMSTELVRNLLPPAWFEFLNSIRSKTFLLDGSIYPYSKFASMGNGFCFPLQTLLFAAACHAVDGGSPKADYLVYGDDIVIRSKHATDLINLLNSIGFAVNTDKTFITGPFRESCGRDWFDGEDVRPFILDFALDSLENYFKFLNLTQRNSRTSEFFREARAFVISRIPPRLRLCRPCKGSADGAYQCELDEFMSSPYAYFSRSMQTWMWYELQLSPIPDKGWKEREDSGQLLMIAALRGADSRQPFTLRHRTRTKVRRVTYCAAQL